MSNAKRTGRPTREYRLAELAMRWFLPDEPYEAHPELRAAMLLLVEDMFGWLSPEQKRQLRLTLHDGADEGVRAPPALVEHLRAFLGATGLSLYLLTQRPQEIKRLKLPNLERDVYSWLKGQPASLQIKVMEAGIRDGIGRATAEDRALLAKAASQWLADKGEQMINRSIDFEYDLSRLPAGFGAIAFDQAVNQELLSNLGVPNDGSPSNTNTYAAVKGLLLLDDVVDPTSFGFSGEVQKRYLELLGKTKDINGQLVSNRSVYDAIASALLTLPGKTPDGNGNITVYYQEFATIGRYVIQNAADVPPGSPNFASQVRIGDDQYVQGQDPFGALDLPPLTGDDGTEQEIQPDLVVAVGKIHSAYYLEILLQTVDRVSEQWHNGLLPVAVDAGGKLLDAYYWNSFQRLNQAGRFMHYSRILGVQGGQVSHEVQPNGDFQTRWKRALAALSEYDRQQRIVDLFSGQQQGRSLSRTGENVRSAIRDLATNVTLYGWGSAAFVANRLMRDIQNALDILRNPQILRAYAVTNPWQVIERQMVADTGSAPNIVKYRTIAQEAKTIFDLIAKYATVWSGATGKPLFPDPTVTNADGQTISDITPDDTTRLMRSTELILAVQGAKDDDIYQASQPTEAVGVASIPSTTDSGRNASFDQIRQMVASGKAPSLDDLKSLIPSMNGNGATKMPV